MVKKPLKNRFKLDLNSFGFAFLGLCFVLFVFFWGDWGRPICSRSSAAVDLAKVRSPMPMRKALREDALTISVAKDGSIFFDSEKVKPEQLPALIQQGVKNGAERKVYIEADARTKIGNVSEVLDSVRASGIENVAFLTERKPTTPNKN